MESPFLRFLNKDLKKARPYRPAQGLAAHGNHIRLLVAVCDEGHQSQTAVGGPEVHQMLLIRNQETTMSMLHKADVYQSENERADRKHPEYSFVLVLVCMALALVVASAIFTPAPVGTGIEITSVGP